MNETIEMLDWISKNYTPDNGIGYWVAYDPEVDDGAITSEQLLAIYEKEMGEKDVSIKFESWLDEFHCWFNSDDKAHYEYFVDLDPRRHADRCAPVMFNFLNNEMRDGSIHRHQTIDLCDKYDDDFHYILYPDDVDEDWTQEEKDRHEMFKVIAKEIMHFDVGTIVIDW